jgi:hypothetical protein
MKMTIEMTNELATIDGVPCRIWTGRTDGDIPVRVYVHRVAVPLTELIAERQTPFSIELIEKKAPRREESRYD